MTLRIPVTQHSGIAVSIPRHDHGQTISLIASSHIQSFLAGAAGLQPRHHASAQMP